jgi:cellulose synthase (UDP-forming)
MKRKKPLNSFIFLVLTLAFITSITYLISRFFFVAGAEYTLLERIISIFLLLAELFIIFHGIGYAFELFRITVRYKQLFGAKEEEHPLKNEQPVAILIPSYDEPLNIIKKTIITCYNLSYKDKQIYLLDDTKYDDTPKMQEYKKELEDMCKTYSVNIFRHVWRGAKAGITNDFIKFISNSPIEGSVCTYNNANDKDKTPMYIAVFDVDQNPFIDFLEIIIGQLEENEKLAFVQTPQYYSNFRENRVALASGMQQAIFYEYICQGKGATDKMISCGTNVVYRLEALLDIKGFDEKSVTEDFATSLLFHYKGWNSAYNSKVGVFGMGPEDMASYFKQQFRWALGTLGLFRKLLGSIFVNFRKLTISDWWEYFISSSYFFYGWVYVILVICPVLYLLFNVPSYFARASVYGIIFVPYFIVTFFVFTWTIKKRNYFITDLFKGVYLIAITFPVYIKASIYAIFGIRKKFEVTKKGASKILPIYVFWPQLILCLSCLIAVFWGICRLIFERHPFFAIVFNIFWCFYNFLILSLVLYFNNPKGE